MDVVVDCDNREYHIDLGIKNFSIKHVRCRYIDINHNEITDMGVIWESRPRNFPRDVFSIIWVLGLNLEQIVQVSRFCANVL